MAKQVFYNAGDHIAAETAADGYSRPAFSVQDRARRLGWNMFAVVFYRLSPRPFHGWRAGCLKLFGARMGPDCHFYPGSKVYAPWNLICEDHVAAGDGVEIYNPAPLRLGSHVILSQGAYVCGATHDFNDAAFPLMAYAMEIGAYAWICARACVGPGVKVAEGAVLGLASTTTKDLEAWTVYAGSPAVKVKERTRFLES